MELILYIVLLCGIIALVILLKPIAQFFGGKGAEQILKKHRGKIFLLLIIFAILLFLSTVIITIPAGYTGVVVSGTGIGSTLSQGIHFKNPLANIDRVPWSTQIIEYTSYDDSVVLTSSDSIVLRMGIIVSYHIDKNYISEVRISNPDYVKVINQVVRNVPKNIASQYLALDIVSAERPNITAKISDEVKSALAESYIVIEKCTVQTISLPLTYEQSIEDTKVAEQRLEQAEFEKNITIKEAQAQAEMIAIVDAQMQQVSSEYLRWLYIRAMTDPNSNIKWILPPGVNIILPDIE